eukprot:s30_g28.t1
MLKSYDWAVMAGPWERWYHNPEMLEEVEKLNLLARKILAEGSPEVSSPVVVANLEEAELQFRGNSNLKVVRMDRIDPPTDQGDKCAAATAPQAELKPRQGNSMVEMAQTVINTIRKGMLPTVVKLTIDLPPGCIQEPMSSRFTEVLGVVHNGEVELAAYAFKLEEAMPDPVVRGRLAALYCNVIKEVLPEVQLLLHGNTLLLVHPDSGQTAMRSFTACLLCADVFRIPLKSPVVLHRGELECGNVVLQWDHGNTGGFARVTLSDDTNRELLAQVEQLLQLPKADRSALRRLVSKAAALEKIVPECRTFIARLWLATVVDGAGEERGGSDTGHPSLGKPDLASVTLTSPRWIRACLIGEGPVEYKLDEQVELWEIGTSASLWGVAGVLYFRQCPVRWFSSPLDQDTLEKFGTVRGDPDHNWTWKALALFVALKIWLSGRTRKAFAIRVGKKGAIKTLFEEASQASPRTSLAGEITRTIARERGRIFEVPHATGVRNQIVGRYSEPPGSSPTLRFARPGNRGTRLGPSRHNQLLEIRLSDKTSLPAEDCVHRKGKG